MLGTTTTLEDLQSDEQRRILDTISQVRKCGLDTVLSLPQIVVCGDQSAGKSSLLEALTEIPFPRNDNLCTRFATEISLRREPQDCLSIRIIPDDSRPQEVQEKIAKYSESITDFADLPSIMDSAMRVMGISNDAGVGSAFARDILSIVIQGPHRPQLTLVDIPGLIQTSTKGVSESDVALVAEITDSYIKQPRTICLAVVSATHDAANQPILQRVRRFDPQGERTLGVITKPDRLNVGSGSEAQFLAMARNEDVFFQLGWHVIKNRKFEERAFSITERNTAEKTFFNTSSFKALPRETVGIDTLRTRLSSLLFNHIKKELPRLQDDLKTTLADAIKEVKLLGESRSTARECRTFMAKLNMQCYDICKAAIGGNYEDEYFKKGRTGEFSLESPSSIARIRAAIQFANNEFNSKLLKNGHKYEFNLRQPQGEGEKPQESGYTSNEPSVGQTPEKARKRPRSPRILSKKGAMAWVKRILLHTRGTELVGNFNPKLISELFWEQSEGWADLATAHMVLVSNLCSRFVSDLLDYVAPQDIKDRIWNSLIIKVLDERRLLALKELEKLVQDCKDFPINYNHYYTDVVHKNRQERIQTQMEKYIPPYSHEHCKMGYHYPTAANDMITKVISEWGNTVTPNMEEFSCEEALDCLLAIYKTQLKTFVANVVTQVVERHIVRGLHDIFSPIVIAELSDARVEALVGEPPAVKLQRTNMNSRIKKLQEGQVIFCEVVDI